MRIAVSYDNGSIFPHVGDAKEFKVYEIENGVVTKSDVYQSSGKGRRMVICHHD